MSKRHATERIATLTTAFGFSSTGLVGRLAAGIALAAQHQRRLTVYLIQDLQTPNRLNCEVLKYLFNRDQSGHRQRPRTITRHRVRRYMVFPQHRLRHVDRWRNQDREHRDQDRSHNGKPDDAPVTEDRGARIHGTFAIPSPRGEDTSPAL